MLRVGDSCEDPEDEKGCWGWGGKEFKVCNIRGPRRTQENHQDAITVTVVRMENQGS